MITFASSQIRMPHVLNRSVFNKNKNPAIILPLELDGVVVNPDKGWVLYNNVAEHSSAALALSTIGYTRFYWAQIQPTNEATYDWSVIDNFITQWAAVGKKVMFGVMNCVSSVNNEYVTPEWVFTAGAAYTLKTYTDPSRVQYIPVWSDAIYQAKCATFAAALAARYDGHADVFAIDPRPLGNYGERHTYEINDVAEEITSTILRAFTNMYNSAFSVTPLFFAMGNPDLTADYIWEAGQGLALRNDGALGGTLDVSYLPALDVPKMFEFWAPYHTIKDIIEDPETPWIGAWDSVELSDSIELGNISLCSFGQFFWSAELGSDADLLLADEEAVVHQLANRMGYHIVLKRLVIPATIEVGATYPITFDWLNKGVARMFGACYVALGLMDGNGDIVCKAWATGTTPANWISDTVVTENINIMFENVNAGNYTLCVALFKATTDSTPTYKLGIQGLAANGWYSLRAINVTTTSLQLAKMAGAAMYLDARKADGTGLPTNSPLTPAWVNLITAAAVEFTFENMLGTYGNFVTSSGGLGTGWTANAINSQAVAANIQTFRANAQYSDIRRTTTIASGAIIYACAEIECTSNQVALKVSTTSVKPNGTGVFEFVSLRMTLGSANPVCYISDGSVSGWANIRVKKVHVFNLTAIFGAGKEPSKNLIDYVFRKHASYIDSSAILVNNDAVPVNFASTTSSGVDITDPLKPFWALDGVDDYFSLAKTSSLDITDAPLAVFATLKLSATAVSCTIFGVSTDATNRQYTLRWDATNKKIEAVLDGVVRYSSANNSVLTGVWYNVGFIHEDGVISGFVNIVESGSPGSYSTTLTSRNIVEVGRIATSAYFKGNIATLSVYAGVNATETKILAAETAISTPYLT